MSPEPVLQARGLIKRFGRVTAIDNADFDLLPGEILAVIGDNGAGKSTMIKALAGAVAPDFGEIRLDGKVVQFRSPIEARESGIETVYQNLALSPSLTIADNMFLGRERRRPGLLGKAFRLLDRGRGPHPHPPARPPRLRDPPGRLLDVRRRRHHDGRHEAAG